MTKWKSQHSCVSTKGQWDWPVVSDELHIVSLVTLLDAVHTDGVAVCCVTGVTPGGSQITSVRYHKTNSRGCSGQLGREYKHELPVKIVHWVAGVTWNLVQALTSAHSLFNGILIVHYFIVWKDKLQQLVNYTFSIYHISINMSKSLWPRRYLSL